MNTLQTVQSRRDMSMALAVAKADRDREGWSEDALAAVRVFVRAHPDEQFLTEAVRQWCVEMQFIEPADNERAWGAVMRRAAKDGLVRKVGYAPSMSSNLSPKTLWQAV